MKVALITTHPGLIENKRIEDEVKALGHEFQLVDLTDFQYEINKGKLSVPGITDLEADVAVFRGIFISLKAISAVAEELTKKGIRMFDNSLLVHQYSINKITDTIKLASNNIPVAETYYSRNFDNYLNKAKELGYPVVVKLTRAGKGAGIYKFNDEDELKAFISDVEENGYKGASYLMQEFFDYKHDLRVLVIGGKIYAMKRIPREGDFRANFSLGGTVEIFEPDEETQQLALDALKSIDMSVGGVDVLIGKDLPAGKAGGRKIILEVNHTPGFVGMEEATNENITRKYVEHVIEKAK